MSNKYKNEENCYNFVDQNKSRIKSKRFAILVRAHNPDEKFKHLFKQLSENINESDTFGLIDTTRNAEYDLSVENLVTFSENMARDLGFNQNKSPLFYDCGDISFYFALRELPDYEKYIFIDYDVHFNEEKGEFLNELISAQDFSQSDFIGLSFRPQDPDTGWGPPCAKTYGKYNCYYCYFPFVILSKRALSFLYSQRILESIKGTDSSSVMQCESFTPSALMAGGFNCLDVNDIIPGAYDWQTMARQLGKDGVGTPMTYKLSVTPGIRMIHPVYSEYEYLSKAYQKFIVFQNNDRDGLYKELKTEHAKIIDITKINEFLNSRNLENIYNKQENNTADLQGLTWADYASSAKLLISKGLYIQAQNHLEDALLKFPFESWVLHDLSRLAERQQDWKMAEMHWRAFLQRGESPDWAFIALSRAIYQQGRLVEAEEVLDQAKALNPNSWEIAAECALIAEHDNRLNDAEVRWQSVIKLNSEAVLAYIGYARVLNALKLRDRARSILTLASDKFPFERQVWEGLGHFHEADQNWIEAARCWQIVLTFSQHSWWVYAALAKALYEQGNIIDANSTLIAAQVEHPNECELFCEHARLAERCDDWLDALSRWERAVRDFPNEWQAHAGKARSLIKLNRVSEAWTILKEALLQLPNEVALLHDCARLAESTHNFVEAAQYWSSFLKLNNTYWWAYAALSDNLRKINRSAEAVSIIKSAPSEFIKSEFILFRELIYGLLEMGDVLDAVRMVDSQPDLFVGRDDFNHLIFDVKTAQMDYEIAVASSRVDPAVAAWLKISNVDSFINSKEKELLLCFESLGGIETGCEFAAVQRTFGAEPLSLLRWSGMTITTLSDMLQSDFADFGESDFIEIGHFDNESGINREYSIKDLKYGAVLHSHTYENQIEISEFKVKLCKRFQFLCRKIREDIRTNEKVFIFKHSIRSVTLEEISNISSSMKRFGGANILIVLDNSHSSNPGTINNVAPYVWLGSMNFSEPFNISRIQEWKVLCESALHLIIG